MILRMFPGVLVTLALAVFFYVTSWYGGEPGSNSAISRERLPLPISGPEFIPAPPQSPNAKKYRNPVFDGLGSGEASISRVVAVSPIIPNPKNVQQPGSRPFDATVTKVALLPQATPNADTPKKEQGMSVARAFPATHPEPAATMAAPADNGNRSDTGKTARPSSPITSVKDVRIGFRNGKPGTVSSTGALASLDESCQTCAVPASYRDVGGPDKGIYVYSAAKAHREKQGLRDSGYSHYKNNGMTYTFGFMHEWSLDSSIGLSVDYLDHEIKGRRPEDPIKNDVRGFVVNADYDGTVLGKYPLSGRAFYGRVRTNGSGLIEDSGYPGGLRDWEEDRHNSFLYGGALKIGVPLVMGDGIKILPEVGVQYMRVKSKSYWARVDQTESVRIPSVDSTSVTLPVAVTVKKDFLQCWGIFSPRMLFGYTREFDNGAVGARTYNSSGASKIYFAQVGSDPAMISGPYYDENQKNLMQFGVGFDIRTAGGWQIMADYVHHWAAKYRNDTFKLELGRCF